MIQINKWTFKKRAGIGLGMYFAIWMGLFIASSLMYPEHFSNVWIGNTTLNQPGLQGLFTDPLTTLPNIVTFMFNNPASRSLLGALTLGGVAIIAAAFFLGGGFALLFAIPLVIILVMLNLFILPIDLITTQNAGVPDMLLYIIEMIFGGMTILAAIQFMSGRGG